VAYPHARTQCEEGWYGTSRARLVDSWFFSTRTTCLEACGRSFVNMYIYIYMLIAMLQESWFAIQASANTNIILICLHTHLRSYGLLTLDPWDFCHLQGTLVLKLRSSKHRYYLLFLLNICCLSSFPNWDGLIPAFKHQHTPRLSAYISTQQPLPYPTDPALIYTFKLFKHVQTKIHYQSLNEKDCQWVYCHNKKTCIIQRMPKLQNKCVSRYTYELIHVLPTLRRLLWLFLILL